MDADLGCDVSVDRIERPGAKVGRHANCKDCVAQRIAKFRRGIFSVASDSADTASPLFEVGDQR